MVAQQCQKKHRTVESQGKECSKIKELETQAQSVGCDIAEGTQNQVRFPVPSSLPAIEIWSRDLTSTPPPRGITTTSLFHYLNPYYSAVQLYLHKKNYHYKGAAFRLHRCINFWRLYISSSVQNPSHAAHSGWSQGFPNTKQQGMRKYRLFWGRLDSKIETHWLRIQENWISRTMVTFVPFLFLPNQLTLKANANILNVCSCLCPTSATYFKH